LSTKGELFCKVCIPVRFAVLTIVGLLFLQAESDPYSLSKRVDLLHQGVTVFKNTFPFGAGLGHSLYFQSKLPLSHSYLFIQPVHNIFLLFINEAGLFISASVSFLFIRYFRRFFLNKQFLYCLLVIFLTGMFDHYWYTLQQNILLIPVIFGILSEESKMN
jgi:hypothetical protein